MMKRYGIIPGRTGRGRDEHDDDDRGGRGRAGQHQRDCGGEHDFSGGEHEVVFALANDELAYELQRALQSSPMFDPKETKLTGQIEVVDASAVTFSFGVTLRLKHPLKL
jgi:hypothetical protein